MTFKNRFSNSFRMLFFPPKFKNYHKFILDYAKLFFLNKNKEEKEKKYQKVA